MLLVNLDNQPILPKKNVFFIFDGGRLVVIASTHSSIDLLNQKFFEKRNFNPKGNFLRPLPAN